MDIAGNTLRRRLHRRKSDVFSLDTSYFSTDLISSVYSALCKGCDLLCKHRKLALAVFFLTLEAMSFLLDVIGKSQGRILLAAFLLSAFGFVMTILTSILKRTREQAEKQLGLVEVLFSVVQLITTLLAVLGIKIINNYTTSILLLGFAVIAVVFVSRKDENIFDSSNLTNDYETELISTIVHSFPQTPPCTLVNQQLDYDNELLSLEVKDMALKFSGAYRQCKPCFGSSSCRKGHRPYPDYDVASEGVPYPYLGGGSSSSTPAWDFTSSGQHPTGRSDTRFTGLFSGDRTPGGMDSASVQSCDVVLEDEDESKEWMAQVEPGVHITFVSLPNGGNDLKRIRFSGEMFNKWQAQRWWGENYDRIMELYNVQRFNRQALHTPPRSEDEVTTFLTSFPRDSSYSRMGSARKSPMASSMNRDWMPRNHYKPSGSKGYFPSGMDQGGNQHYTAGSSGFGARGETSSFDASRTTTSSRDEPSISVSNASEVETEWVEEDEPGVYITIRQLADGTRELRRIRFSREKFGEVHAKSWWEENRERIQAQYL